MKRDFPVIIIILLLVVVVIILFRNSGIKKEEIKIIDPPVIVSKPRQGSLRKEFTINGYIESDEVVIVLPRVIGLLDITYCDVGDRVEKDQVIARIDSELLQLNLRQADSAYQYAKLNFERLTALYDQKMTSLQNYELAKTQYESSLSQYEMAKLRFEYAEIKSPIAGAVLKKHISEGSLASQQTPIMTIGTIDKLKITARIPERYFDRFYNSSDKIRVTISRSDNKRISYESNIRTISPVISPESKNFEVICDIDNSNTPLRPGMFVRITFLLREKDDVFYLPLTTLVSGNIAWFYDIKTETAHKIQMNLDFFNDLYYQIPEEIHTLFYIIEGQSFLREGQRVAVMNKEIFN